MLIAPLTASSGERDLAAIAAALVKDPKSVKATLDRIESHRRKANAIVATANERIAKAEALETDLRTREKAAAEAEKRIDAKTTAFDERQAAFIQSSQATTATLQDREEKVMERESKVDSQARAAKAELDQAKRRMAEVEKRETAVAVREQTAERIIAKARNLAAEEAA